MAAMNVLERPAAGYLPSWWTLDQECPWLGHFGDPHPVKPVSLPRPPGWGGDFRGNPSDFLILLLGGCPTPAARPRAQGNRPSGAASFPFSATSGEFDLDPLTLSVKAVGRKAGRAEGHRVGLGCQGRYWGAPHLSCPPSSCQLSPSLSRA